MKNKKGRKGTRKRKEMERRKRKEEGGEASNIMPPTPGKLQ